ncbi:hypothetical protein E4U19_005844 [Claviceps sp. Clav32 group G5]|nr:hypothetical protein E4U19_005844 [Claviceps sp. Clav32 group G5]
MLSTSAASHSLASSQLRATGIAPHPEHGASFPKPTPPPRPDDSHQDLVKKTAALETLTTMMIVPDNTCGWLSARIDVPYTCVRGDTCGLVLAQPTGAVMCYNVNDETTNSSFPYCGTYDFLGGITDYRCHSISEPAQAILTSWRQDGETGRKTYSNFFVKFVLPFSGHIDLTSIPKSAVVASPTTTSAATGAYVGSSGGENPTKDGSKLPVGAIVGGVKESNRWHDGDSPSSNQPSMQPMASTGMSMTQNQDPAFYDSHSNHGSKPLQTYPASAEQYPRTIPSTQGGYFSQPSLDSSSPTVSKISDFRISQMAASLTPTSTDAYGAPASEQQLHAQQTQSGDSRAVQDQQQQTQRTQGHQPQIHQLPLETPVHEVAA